MQAETKRTWPGTRALAAILALSTALLGGCWNGDVSNVRLPDVSLGQQLIDLKRALEEEAISGDEYEATREKLLSLYAICECGDESGEASGEQE